MDQFKLIVPTYIAEELSTEPGVTVNTRQGTGSADLEFTLGEAATIITILAGSATLIEKIGWLAAKLKDTVRGESKILLRSKDDDIPLSINADMSVDDIASALERVIRSHANQP